MKTKLDELIEWMEDEYKSISKINREAPSAFLSITDDEDAVLRCLAKARELRDAQQHDKLKEIEQSESYQKGLENSRKRYPEPTTQPPYDREAFTRELIVGLHTKTNDTEWVMKKANDIIAEYERRQGNG
jgi:hypothetical protein